MPFDRAQMVTDLKTTMDLAPATSQASAEDVADAIIDNEDAIESVTAPSLVNNWVNYGGGFEDSGYYKDNSERVHLQGMIKNGTATTICTLPSGYRPDKTEVFIASTSGASFIRIDVLSTGVVAVNGAVPTWLSLSSISFRVA